MRAAAPNPIVGSVLVYTDPDTGEERIIGEGYHERYGEKHAEANCVASVRESDRVLISRSTLYVSLEPCAHYGKQPPCADSIIEKNIPRVVAGCRYPFPSFRRSTGRGSRSCGPRRWRADPVGAGGGVQGAEQALFYLLHTKHRPFVVLEVGAERGWENGGCAGDGECGGDGECRGVGSGAGMESEAEARGVGGVRWERVARAGAAADLQ